MDADLAQHPIPTGNGYMKRVLVLSTSSTYPLGYLYCRNYLSSGMKAEGIKFDHWVTVNEHSNKKNKVSLSRLIHIIKPFIKSMRKGKFFSYFKFKLERVIFKKEIDQYHMDESSLVDSYFSTSNCELIQPEVVQINSLIERFEKLKEFEYTHLICLAGPYLRKEIISKFNKTINLHFGFLPYYKGSRTIEWAILKQDYSRVGFSIHSMTSKLDGGKIYYREAIEGSKSAPISKIYMECFKKAPVKILEILKSDLEPQIENDLNVKCLMNSSFGIKQFRKLFKRL